MKKHTFTLSLFLALTIVMFIALAAPLRAEEKVLCPVMGNEVKDLEKAPSYEYEGKTYYFCCPGCKEKFIENPEKYLQKKEEMEHQMQEHKEMKMHQEMQEHKEMKMHKTEAKSCCAMSGLMHSEEIKVDIENTEDGIAVKITSENPDVVKKLQEMGPQMMAMHEKMGSSCEKEDCCKEKAKKEVKKEEVKK